MHRRSSGEVRGFTLIELLVVIAIIGVLSSVVLASLNAARARARYTSAVQQMREIATAAEMDALNRGSYLPDVGLGVNPGFAELSRWPTPPCAGWSYDWDAPAVWPVARITLRNASSTAIYHYCVYSATGSCVASDVSTDIRSASSKQLSC